MIDDYSIFLIFIPLTIRIKKIFCTAYGKFSIFIRDDPGY
jgi:hypothetical protein